MKNLRMPTLLLCLLLALLPMTIARAQTNQVTVGFEPPTMTIGTGAINEIAVSIQDVQDLYAFDLTIQFDPAFLEVEDANGVINGIQVNQGNFLEGGMVITNAVDNQAGTIRFATTQLNPSPARSGSGILLVIRLIGKAQGTTALSLADVQLATRDGNQILASRSKATITISDVAPNGPTPTPFAVIQPKMQFTEGTMVANQVTAVPEGTEAAAGTASQGNLRNGTATLAPTYTPTVVSKRVSETPVAGTGQNPDWFSNNWGMLCIVSTIIELLIAILVVVWLRNKKSAKSRK